MKNINTIIVYCHTLLQYNWYEHELLITLHSTHHRSNVFLLQGLAICDIDKELGQKSLQELTEEYGKGRVIFIQVDVRSYQQLEGDRNLLWRDEKRHHKYTTYL
jgi:hypothetical protein